MLSLLVELFNKFGKKKVPKEWIDVISIPIPKKDDLRNCNNWRYFII